jgi:hypothetical protein
LAMVASVESIFLSTFILISQNRMAAAADKRADLDLQTNLLSEHEVTKLIAPVSSIADRMGVKTDADPEADELKHDVAPEASESGEAHEHRGSPRWCHLVPPEWVGRRSFGGSASRNASPAGEGRRPFFLSAEQSMASWGAAGRQDRPVAFEHTIGCRNRRYEKSSAPCCLASSVRS